MTTETRFVVQPDEILRCEVGSGLHGIAIEGTDDHDEMGIFIEEPEVVLGLRPAQEHRVVRSQPEGIRSGPDDTDLVVYSLRKYMRLAVAGNPTIILPLFAPEEKILFTNGFGRELRVMRDAIVSRQAGRRFLGYMDSQVARFEGRKKMPTVRTELIEKYGYDTKFASHALRLGFQGVELLETGSITLPMVDSDLKAVRGVKEGRWAMQAVLEEAGELRGRLERLALGVDDSPLPPEPDWDKINWWMKTVHLMHWEGAR